MRILSRTVGIALLVSAGACTVNQVRSGPRTIDPAGVPTGLGPAQRGGAAPASRGTNEVRRVCRGRVTAGWIAIDYEVSDECPAAGGGAEQYNGALIVSYGGFPRDSELLVCAGQTIPRGWSRRELPQGAAVEGQCSSSLASARDAPRVMLIRKV